MQYMFGDDAGSNSAGWHSIPACRFISISEMESVCLTATGVSMYQAAYTDPSAPWPRNLPKQRSSYSMISIDTCTRHDPGISVSWLPSGCTCSAQGHGATQAILCTEARTGISLFEVQVNDDSEDHLHAQSLRGARHSFASVLCCYTFKVTGKEQARLEPPVDCVVS